MNPIPNRPAVAAGIAILRRSMSFLFVLLSYLSFAQPAISSFSPTSGPVGTAVTINGSGFNATTSNNIVFFGPVKATVTSATATQLVVNVPANAGPQPFTVTTGGLTAFSAKPFWVGIPGMDAVSTGGITNSGNRGGITDYWNTGKTSLASTDLNADGKPELLAGMDNGNMMRYNNTSTPGTILLSRIAPEIVGGTNPFPLADIVAGDLDGDGVQEILVADEWNDKVTIFSNTMAVLRTLGVTNSGPNSLVISDMDNDGKPDLVIGCDRNASMRVFRNTSTAGTLSFASNPFNTSGFMARLAVRDLNGDGKPDIAGVIPDNNGGTPVQKIGLLLNTSTGAGTISFSFSTITVGVKPEHIQLDDLDGDDKPDMVVSYPDAGKITLYHNQSAGSIAFDAGTDATTTDKPAALAIADIDGDGKPEIVAGNKTNSSLDIFKNNSVSNAFNFSRVNIATSFTADRVLVNDFDGDSKNDIAISSLNTSGIEVLRNIISEPVITSFTPTGTVAGGTVTIQGLYLASATEVSFGGTPASSFVVNADGSITATIANGTSGIVMVKTPYGTAKSAWFSFYRPPTFTTFTPTAAATGSTVTITGTNFTGSTQVTFGGVPATSFTVNGSGTAISAVVGAGASGTIEVIHPAGNVSKTGFIYMPPVTITSFSPTSGKTGDQIIIDGNNFINYLGQGNINNNGISLGGVAAASFTYLSNTQIRVTIGNGATGDVRVSARIGGVLTLPGFTYIGTPTITSFTPTSGSNGDVITITGTNLTGATAVSFGGTAATSFTVVNATTITATLAGGASGDISITTPGGTAALAGFTYVTPPPPPPVITSFTPATGITGDVITINGTNFTSATAVSFGGTAAGSFTVVNGNTITATIANGATGNVQITTPNGTASLAGFTYIPAPVITGFTPASAAGGQTVTITGSGFTNASAVSLGGTPVASFTVVNATTITATVGAGASGNVVVTTPGGTATLGGFTFTPITAIPTPVITSISPAVAGAGDTVIISGFHLTNALSVTLGGAPVQYYSVLSSNSIIAVVGTGSSGNVSVTTPVGTATLPGFTFREQAGGDLVIYPNPVSNKSMFWVKHRAEGGLKWICIFDNTGKVVKIVPVQPGTAVTSIYAGDLKSGYYQVAIQGTIYKQVKTLMVW